MIKNVYCVTGIEFSTVACFLRCIFIQETPPLYFAKKSETAPGNALRVNLHAINFLGNADTFVYRNELSVVKG